MSLTIHDRVRTGALDGALAELNKGTTDAGGDCQLLNAADAEIALLTFANPAFAPASAIVGVGAEAQSNAIGADSSVTPSEVIAKIKWRDRDNVVMVQGTVGLAGSNADLILTETTLPSDTNSVSSPGLSCALVLV